MPKLTLNADEDVIKKAKRIARQRGTSVSSLFSQFIRSTAQEPADSDDKLGPITRRVAGIAKLPPDVSDRDLIVDAIAEKHLK